MMASTSAPKPLFCVSGQSMFPTLKHNDRVFVEKVPAFKIRTRDIIVYENNYCTVAHRVVNIIHDSDRLAFYTRGDFSRRTEKVTDDRILGRVAGVYRKGGWKLLSFEESFAYFSIINIISVSKELLRKAADAVCAFSFIRRAIRLLFPLDVKYVFIEDIKQNNDFMSFYNCYPFSVNEYVVSFGLLAKHRDSPAGKLLVLQNGNDDYFLFGPYVKVPYRARNAGKFLIKNALGLIKKRDVDKDIYAFIDLSKPLEACFKRFGFSPDDKLKRRLLKKTSQTVPE